MVQELLQFIVDNSFILNGFAIVWCISFFSLTWLWIKKKGIVFPSKSTVKILFEEKMASGRSHKSVITKLGGGRNCLNIIVTSDELWITAVFPFNLVAFYYDGIHKIPLSLIRKTYKSGKSVFVEFQRKNGSPGKFELQLKNPNNFLGIFDTTVNNANAGDDRTSP